MVQLTVLDRRWLQSGDTDGVVLNHMARALFPNLQIGGAIYLMHDGKVIDLRVVGIVRELLTPRRLTYCQRSLPKSLAWPGRQTVTDCYGKT